MDLQIDYPPLDGTLQDNGKFHDNQLMMQNSGIHHFDQQARLLQQNNENQQEDEQLTNQQLQEQQEQENYQSKDSLKERGGGGSAMDQQQQFEQNVQSIFGIGQQTGGGQGANNQQVGMYNDYDPFSEANTYDVNTSAFFTALSLNALLFVVLIGCYEVLRRYFPSVYSARQNMPTSSSRGLVSPKSSSAPAVNVNTGRAFGWVSGVVGASWSTVLSKGGLDSYMFLRYVRLCFRITFTSALWGMIILWPVYATGDGGAKGWYFLSMANISQGSNRLWVPAVFMWLQTMYGKLYDLPSVFY